MSIIINNDPGEQDKDVPNNWVILAVAILPAVLPVIVQKISDEVSDFFRRKRVAKRKAEAEFMKLAKKAAKNAQ